MRTMIKSLQQAEDPEKARLLFQAIKAFLDRLAAKGIIHKNKAANYKSQLERRVNSLG